MKPQDDSALVDRCLNGDGRAFEQIVDMYQGPVFKLARSMTRNIEDALDIAQSVFLKVYQNLDSYEPHRSFFSWLYRIALNEGINYSQQLDRRQGHHQNIDRLDDHSLLVSRNASPEDDYRSIELQEGIARAIHELTRKQQLVILLRHASDFSYSEIAEALQIPVRTVKSRLYSARHNLREILEREGMFS